MVSSQRHWNDAGNPRPSNSINDWSKPAMSAALAIEPVRTTETRKPVSSTYNLSIGYLRAFITLLVLAHHAVLAYHPFAPPPPASLVAIPRWWSAFPIVDAQHSTVFALFAGFNDMFFMALMFFLSGLFVWPSLQRKGAGQFVRDRALRLGIPLCSGRSVRSTARVLPGLSANRCERRLLA
jgi:hypothetical protein